jgi:hypothetical protein
LLAGTVDRARDLTPATLQTLEVGHDPHI